MQKIVNKTARTVFNIILFLIFFVPFYWMVLTSVKTLGETLAFPPKFWVSNPQWENFITAFNAIPFWIILKIH